MLQPARALLAEREEEAAAPGDWMHSAFRLVGVNVGTAGLGPRDAEMDQVPEAAAAQLSLALVTQTLALAT